MKETGLMFKAPLVHAILEGRKTQTRRIVKPQPVAGQGMVNAGYCGDRHLWLRDGPCDKTDPAYEWRCPMGKPCDRIYVRQTYWAWGRWETRYSEAKGRDEWHFVDLTLEYGRQHEFADPQPGTRRRRAAGGTLPAWWKRPSILMPKTAARIWLEITGVRVERLQSISPDDCISEGAWPADQRALGRGHEAIAAFRELWESTGGDWGADPWLWVIDFKTISTTGRPA